MRLERYTNRDYAFSKRLIAVEQEFINRFFEDDTTEKEKVLLVLKSCEANIHPSSSLWNHVQCWRIPNTCFQKLSNPR